MVHLETKRQTTHLISGLFFATLIHMSSDTVGFALLSAGLAGILLFSKVIGKGKYIPFFSELVWKTERKGAKTGSGAAWFLFGSLIVLILGRFILMMPKEFVVGAILIVAIGDSVSTGLGRKRGKKLLPRTTTKSYVGSGVGFGLAAVVVFFLLWPKFPVEQSIVLALSAGLSGLLAEAYLRSINDNLSIPLASFVSMAIVWLFL